MRVRWQDVLVISGFLLYFGAGFSTNFALTTVGVYTEAANQLESSPVARATLNFRYGLLMIQVASTAVLGGIYFMLRKRFLYKKIEYGELLITFFSVALFLVFLQNFLNDAPIALKMWMEIAGA